MFPLNGNVNAKITIEDSNVIVIVEFPILIALIPIFLLAIVRCVIRDLFNASMLFALMKVDNVI